MISLDSGIQWRQKMLTMTATLILFWATGAWILLLREISLIPAPCMQRISTITEVMMPYSGISTRANATLCSAAISWSIKCRWWEKNSFGIKIIRVQPWRSFFLQNKKRGWIFILPVVSNRGYWSMKAMEISGLNPLMKKPSSPPSMILL